MTHIRSFGVLILTVFFSITLVACTGNIRNEQFGQAVGGLAGGLLAYEIFGGNIAGTALGALAGVWFGGEIGKSMDRRDKYYVNETLETQTSGSRVKWNNPDTGHSYSVTPTRTWYSDVDTPCREYRMTVMVGGERREMIGMAKRDYGGTWRDVHPSECSFR
jgi:surface antigen